MLKTPNSNTIGNAAVMVGAGVVGAKISDGIVAILPDSIAKYRKFLVAGLALVGAASVDGKTTTGKAVQASLVGAAIKQGSDAATELLATNVDPKDNTTVTGRFVNAVVGHSTAMPPVATTVGQTATPTSRLGNAYVDWVPASPVQEPMSLGV